MKEIAIEEQTLLQMDADEISVHMDKPCGKGFIAEWKRCHDISPGQTFVESNDPKWSNFQRQVFQAVSSAGNKTPFSQEKRDVVFQDLGIENWSEAQPHIPEYFKFGFTPEEFYDLSVYTGAYSHEDFTDVAWRKNNAALRGDSEAMISDGDKAYALGLVNSLKKIPPFKGNTNDGRKIYDKYIDSSGELVQTKQPLNQLYRRIRLDSEAVNSLRMKAETKDFHVEKSFSSTTTDPYGVGTVTEGSNVEMRIKWRENGSQGRWIGGENEVLFLPGTQFKVTSFEDRPDHPRQSEINHFRKILKTERAWTDYQETLNTGFLNDLVNKVRGLPRNREEFYKANYNKKPPLPNKVAEAKKLSLEIINYNFFYEKGSVKHIVHLEEV
jgi:hypothetical protein